MLQLFEPVSKVQRNRNIMRETDARVAKYSRRGLLMSVSVFILTLVLGDFYGKATNLAIFLTSVLFLITIGRGYLLFRFETLYPKAPARWRNMHFCAAFAGSMWWGVILSSLTIVLGFQPETNFLWLYTVVFYASICNVFAPYQRFLNIYLFIGLIPVALSSFSLFSLDGYLYGTVMLALFLLLRNQGNLVSRTYWERLEANYALRQKANILEIEKRDSQAAADLSHSFFVSLSDEFRASLNDIVGALSVISHGDDVTSRQRTLINIAEKASDRQLQVMNSVMDYSKIKANKLLVENTVFNLPKLLETLFNEKEPEAEVLGKELAVNYSASIPTRVRGDSIRLAQLITALLDRALGMSRGVELTVNINFDTTSENQSNLLINIQDDDEEQSPTDQETQAHDNAFSFNMSKHLAVAMGGGMGIKDLDNFVFWIRVPLEPVSNQSFVKQYESKFHGETTLVVNPPAKIEEELVDVLKQWGLKPRLVGTNESVKDVIQHCQEMAQPAQIAVVFSRKDSLTAVAVSEQITDADTQQDIYQFLVVSHLQAQSDILNDHLQQHPLTAMIQKPVTQDKLYNAIADKFKNNAANVGHVGSHALLIDDNSVDQLVVSKMLEKMNISVDIAAGATDGLKRLQSTHYDLIFLSCHLNGCSECEDSFNLAGKIHAANDAAQRRIPLLGMTTQKSDQQDRLCLTSGMDDTIAKPIRREELKKSIDHWLVQ
ncbi:response regulator [Marinibactrum halimedae]|uniref:Response regulator n=1 Tax=Marinibactrum halimedae TaxID=1444977 RepID=A0AA37T616_9GAMM|nr:response regulator [Marinibactrum halimedae]MCD9459464.1 response regulator [Marinibactrum halimedae]GLS28118.1 hypothetical protein GCM10007877_38370 [Marinibactrum halimedae]